MNVVQGRACICRNLLCKAPALPPVARPIRSLLATAQKQAPEVLSFACVDPVETAADKLSGLAWRVCAGIGCGQATIRRSSAISTTGTIRV
jgi:hypothetical protein